MKTCAQCQSSFEVTDEDRAFYEKISPVFDGRKYLIPEPTLCPRCRSQRRLTWRNESSLYKRKCDYSKEPIVSMFSPESTLPVYKNEHWYDQKYDPFEHGKEVDFNRSIFEQIQELAQKVPRSAVDLSGENVNSDYTNCSGDNQNCYLIFNSAFNQNCLYSRGLGYSRDCLDCYFGSNNELCYECINCNDCYNLNFSINAAQCSDSSFLFNCIGCKNCFGCTNLNHKEYYIFNKPYSKEEYEKQMEKFKLSNYQQCQRYLKQFKTLVQNSIHRENQNLLAENCSGDLIKHAKNCQNCFEVSSSEDCKFLDSVKHCKDSYDVFGFGYYSEQLYETVTTGKSFKAIFCAWSSDCNDIYYCQYCKNCSDCFACFGLQNQKYCILNKQYTKEEYETLVPKIIEQMRSSKEWGEFFPIKDSPFGYNETKAQEFYPLGKEEVQSKGWKWNDYETSLPPNLKSIPAKDLPDDINQIPDDILNWAINCEESNKPFRITKQELQFYRNQGLPIPHFSPSIRQARRMEWQKIRVLFDRKCDHCGKDIRATYSPERSEKVYCEYCYLESIY